MNTRLNHPQSNKNTFFTAQNILVITWVGLCVLAVLVFLSGCKCKKDAPAGGDLSGTTSISNFRVADATGNYEAVNINTILLALK